MSKSYKIIDGTQVREQYFRSARRDSARKVMSRKEKLFQDKWKKLWNTPDELSNI